MMNMTNTFRSLNAKAETRACMQKAATPLRLVRKFIETGDERCPLAGLWTELALNEQLDDNSELRMPVWRFFSPGGHSSAPNVSPAVWFCHKVFICL